MHLEHRAFWRKRCLGWGGVEAGALDPSDMSALSTDLKTLPEVQLPEADVRPGLEADGRWGDPEDVGSGAGRVSH